MTSILDAFFDHYYRQRPVNATFTGVHDFDAKLPDWSVNGLAQLDSEMQSLLTALDAVDPAQADALDASLAADFCRIQLSENSGAHGPRGNPALWTGEAVFSVISLMIRDFAPLEDRIENASGRLEAMPAFLAEAAAHFGTHAAPAAWVARAQRDLEGARVLLRTGLDRWLSGGSVSKALDHRIRAAAVRAATAVDSLDDALRSVPGRDESAMQCGETHYDLVLHRGHRCDRSASDLLADARSKLSNARRLLQEEAARLAGSWEQAQARLAEDHPTAAGYLEAFERIWTECRDAFVSAGTVSWPDWPIRYTEIPSATREAAPFLYYLFYRSPAPFDSLARHDYVVTPLPDTGQDAHLRSWNHSVIRLNHALHHGGVGHHVQNWNAYHRCTSRIARVAAVDCANRIGMFCGGTMAEGWACYATGLADEIGLLTPLERLSELHSRVRQLARAVIDLAFHSGEMSLDEAAAFFANSTGVSDAVARNEAVKCSMFPGTPIMYWIGTDGLLDLRDAVRRREGREFSLKRFHDTVLSFGSIPVPLIRQRLLGAGA